MNKFKKPYSSRSSSGPRSGGRFDARGPSRPDGFRQESSQKFDAICSKCGKACQVPFRPNGVRPVYCNDCFGGHGSPLTRGVVTKPFEPQAGGKSIADLERQIGAMNTKIDTMLRILEAMPHSDASEDFTPPPSSAKRKFGAARK